MSAHTSNIILFLIGLFSHTQIHVMGSIGISELVIFIVAPFVLVIKYGTLRREGFKTIVWLSLLACLGCFIASMLGKIHPIVMMKGIAAPYAVFSSVVVLHSLLRKNMDGLKWILLGMALSLIVNIFIFQPESSIVRGGIRYEGEAAIALVTSGVLFWSNRVSAFLTLPIQGWYLKTPFWYSFLAPVFVAVFFLFYSGGSGRSASLATFISVVLILIGRKDRRTMFSISKHVVLILISLIMVIFIFKIGYQFAAPRGWLGEEAVKKFERITNNRNNGFLGFLISGRLHTFIGLRACFDRPIMGFGSKAIDRWGYTERMLDRYGNAQDYENYINAVKTGMSHSIPAHSHIVASWLDCGIFGLVLWCYILYIIYGFFRYYTGVVPHWYGYFVMTIPSSVWDIFFSPFGDRIDISLLITCLLLASAINKGMLQFPIEMEYESKVYRK